MEITKKKYVWVDPEIHTLIKVEASKEGVSMKEFVKQKFAKNE